MSFSLPKGLETGTAWELSPPPTPPSPFSTECRREHNQNQQLQGMKLLFAEEAVALRSPSSEQETAGWREQIPHSHRAFNSWGGVCLFVLYYTLKKNDKKAKDIVGNKDASLSPGPH